MLDLILILFPLKEVGQTKKTGENIKASGFMAKTIG